jgi:hypothetical protein
VDGNVGGDRGCALVGLVHGLGGAVGDLGAPLREERHSFVEQGPCGFAPGNHVAQDVVDLEGEPCRAALMGRSGGQGGERGRQRPQHSAHHADRRHDRIILRRGLGDAAIAPRKVQRSAWAFRDYRRDCVRADAGGQDPRADVPCQTRPAGRGRTRPRGYSAANLSYIDLLIGIVTNLVAHSRLLSPALRAHRRRLISFACRESIGSRHAWIYCTRPLYCVATDEASTRPISPSTVTR